MKGDKDRCFLICQACGTVVEGIIVNCSRYGSDRIIRWKAAELEDKRSNT